MKIGDELMEQLSAYLDDELPPQARDAVEARLAKDAEARRAMARLRQVTEAVRALPRETPPADMVDVIQSRLARRQLLGENAPERGVAVRRLGWLRPATMAAALLLAAGLSWRIWFAPRPSAPTPADYGITPGLPFAAPTEAARSSERKSTHVATRERKRDDTFALGVPNSANYDTAVGESAGVDQTEFRSFESSDGPDKERSLALEAESDAKIALAESEKWSSVTLNLHADGPAVPLSGSVAQSGEGAADAAPRSAPPPTRTAESAPPTAPPTPMPPQAATPPPAAAAGSPVKRPMFNPSGEWVTFMMLLCPTEDSASQACRRMLAFDQPGLTVQTVIIAFAGMGSEGTTLSLRGSPDLLADALFAAQGEIDPATGRHECTFRLKAGERQFTRDGLREWLRPKRKTPTTTAAAAATAPATQPDPEGLVVVRVVRRPTATATAPAPAPGGANGR